MNAPAKIERGDLPATATPMEMISHALVSGSDVSVIEKLMDLQERWQDGERRAEFAAAKAKAMADMPTIPRNGHNKHTGQKYATRDDIIVTVRPVLAACGMTLSHRSRVEDGEMVITAVLAHANGVEETNSIPLPFDNGQQRNAVQARGSAQTYGERYTARALLGLDTGEIDDDAAAASATITAEQYQTLKAKLDKIGPDDQRRLVAYLKVKNIEELPLSKFGVADAALDRKIKEAENA